MFPCLIIALVLALAGVQQVEFGNSYYEFMQSVSIDMRNWSLEIPKIPSINTIDEGGFDSGGLILSVLIKIGNFFVGVINAFISVINIFITILNVVIKLIQFCIILIKRLFSFRDSVSSVVVR